MSAGWRIDDNLGMDEVTIAARAGYADLLDAGGCSTVSRSLGSLLLLRLREAEVAPWHDRAHRSNPHAPPAEEAKSTQVPLRFLLVLP